MGKSKKRILHKGINNMFDNITRDEALSLVIKDFAKKNKINEIKELISLFGFSGEELLENGAKYEDVVNLKVLLSS